MGKAHKVFDKLGAMVAKLGLAFSKPTEGRMRKPPQGSKLSSFSSKPEGLSAILKRVAHSAPDSDKGLLKCQG